MDSQIKFFELICSSIQSNLIIKGNIMNITLVNDQIKKEKEKGLMSTFKSASIRGLNTVDEAFRIIETGAKDVRLALELVEVQFQVAKGSALIEGVREFMDLGLNQEQANEMMKKLRAD